MKFKRLQISIFLLLTIVTGSVSGIQPGKITGKVVDQNTNETLIGVPVLVQGTQMSAVTDLDGKFSISPVPPGKYSLLFRLIGYAPKLVEGIEITGDKTIQLDVAMETSNQQLQEVVITADIKKESIGSILLMQKKSGTVQDGISSEAIRKTPDKNSGEIIRRISGASVQEGRFVIIRGLNERYNNAMVNGVPLSSTEPDRKAFSFDLFPAS
ncbi:MAG TPA: carboxypeptidase-like regulatory domain-containing protein, partial [Bacteroidia bacterium]|nr:carboxypeptidase-like regulatory domain-containing protein [Bacteroidia bacterium]